MKKILIVRFSSIGDIVLTTPVIRCLQLQTGFEVHFLTKKAFANILENNIYVNKVWTIEKEISAILPALRKENFDFIIDLHKNLRTFQLRLQLGVKTFAFRKLNFEKWLLVNLKINRLPAIHIVDRYLATVKALGVENDEQGLDYFIPEKDHVSPANYQLKPYQFTAFVIGAAHTTKRLTVDKIVEFCHQISDPIVLLGGPDDVTRSLEIEKKLSKKVTNLCGKLNLNQSASMLQQAEKVITHDTGLMHIAAAFNKKIISIWCNTVPEFGMYPYLNKNQFKVLEVKNLSCRPCSKIGHKTCPKGHFKCQPEVSNNNVVL
jgi:ADP-heptose:LPS heptosyltransferase